MRTDDAGLAAFAHEAAQSQQGSAAHLGQASRPGDTWSQVIAAQVSLGGRGSTLRDPSACLGGKPVLQTIKNSETAALAANWPHRTAFSDYNRSSCCSQVPLKTIGPSLRASAHRCERVNFISARQSRCAASQRLRARRSNNTTLLRKQHHTAAQANAAARRRRGAAAGLPRIQRLATTAPRALNKRSGLPVLGTRPRRRRFMFFGRR